MTEKATVQEALQLSEESLNRLFHQARSINSFSGGPLTQAQMRQVYELTKLPPTMMNSQPLRITWVASPEQRDVLASCMKGSNARKTLDAPTTAILSFDADFHEHIPFLFPHAPERKAYFMDPQPRAERARENGWLQAGYFLLGVRALGFDVGPITGADFAAIDARFNAGNAHHAFMIVNIGRPGPEAFVDRLPRFDFEETNSVV